MKNKQSQDYIIYKKSKRRVTLRLIATYIFLCAYFVGVYYLMHLDFFTVEQSTFDIILIGGMIAQLCIFSILFMMLSTGKKAYRILYWITFIMELILFYYPISELIDHTESLPGYLLIIVCMLIKVWVLWKFGAYLQKNASAKVFFDHVIEVTNDGRYEEPLFDEDLETPEQIVLEPEEEDFDQPVETETIDDEPTLTNQQPVIESAPVHTETADHTKHKHITTDDIAFMELTSEKQYPHLAIRMALIVYISLMVFPILTQVFSSFFYSNDNTTVFASHDMFMACVITAMVWTIPILYLYYNHPASKKIIMVCFGIEIVRVLIYLPTFIGYMTNTEVTYPLRVFIFYILLELVRYVLLFLAARPVFRLPIPEKTDDEEDD